ncbi:hypothetical protein ACPPVO_23560 [Dactylosporangium sp. McL0621]|uniref:hypothetical protein n=1 Tax=Dactylosporangium sp. McL0621 TaxID=3415678 RepID=UPI003CF15606
MNDESAETGTRAMCSSRNTDGDTAAPFRRDLVASGANPARDLGVGHTIRMATHRNDLPDRGR